MRQIYFRLFIIILFFAGCGDYAGPTAVERGVSEADFSPLRGGGDRWVACSLYQRSSRGGHNQQLRAKRISIRFPREEQGSSGEVYSYRGYANGGELTAYADCTIPATDAARRRMDHLLKVERGSRPQRALAASGPLYSTSDPIILDPVMVTACQYGGRYPDCQSQPVDHEMTEDNCLWYSNCPGTYYPDSGGGDTGGSSYTWTDWYHPQDDGTGRPACTRDADGICVTRDPSPDEWTKLGELINKINDDTDVCRAVKAGLQSLYGQGRSAQRFRFWDGYDIAGGVQRYGQHLKDSGGSFIEFDGKWVLDPRMPTLLIHEGLHKYLHDTNSTMDVEQAHAWIPTVQNDCL
ncbi:MAG TPA: hypothetical protein VEY93_08065 [Longimicrobium sp.]|nr:hypothetical protein [Longimicrobium sp.]